MKLNILYFASLREQLDCAAEDFDVPATVTDLASLRAHLVARGDAWQPLAQNRVRAAVNQGMVGPDHLLSDGDEVAFFPPVTGG